MIHKKKLDAADATIDPSVLAAKLPAGHDHPHKIVDMSNLKKLDNDDLGRVMQMQAAGLLEVCQEFLGREGHEVSQPSVMGLAVVTLNYVMDEAEPTEEE